MTKPSRITAASGNMHPLSSLTLGPLLFNWEPRAWSDFYARIADEAPVDRVCIGEVICAKRLPLYADQLASAIERLRRAGKRVVLSSLALVTLPRERRQTEELAAATGCELEINDLTALRYQISGPFAVGPFVNVYNEGTLDFLARCGAGHVCLPPELPLTSVTSLAAAARTLGMEAEVWAFGRLPLALSGRCYHARLHGLAKDNCRFVCGDDPDGRPVDTIDGKRFLAVNGVQTVSFAYANLLSEIPTLRDAGIGSFRISPQTCDMVAVAQLFRKVLDGSVDPNDATAELCRLLPEAQFANGFLAGPYGAAYTGGLPHPAPDHR